jgi:hypothetical protein
MPQERVANRLAVDGRHAQRRRREIGHLREGPLSVSRNGLFLMKTDGPEKLCAYRSPTIDEHEAIPDTMNVRLITDVTHRHTYSWSYSCYKRRRSGLRRGFLRKREIGA